MEVSLLKGHIIISNFTEFADQKRRRRGERTETERPASRMGRGMANKKTKLHICIKHLNEKIKVVCVVY